MKADSSITFARAWIAPLVLLLCLGPAKVRGQPPSADVSGRWLGGVDIRKSDGTIQHDTAYFILTQDGDKLSGSAGPDERQQSRISEGAVTKSAVRFTVEVRPGTSVMFSLRRDGDHLRGEATGNVWEANSRISVDTVRLKSGPARAASAGEEIFQRIAGLDARLFAAYNARDLPTLETFLTRDLEFYHDKGGLTGFEQNMESFRSQFSSDTRTRRELVEGTLEVYPVPGYGAVELGVHRFYSKQGNQPERLTATARFVHLWQEKDGLWKISRVISYDHR